MTRQTAPVLLTFGEYQGTLAATRSLGRAGVPVVLAESRLLAPARWSRYITRRVSCPVPDLDPDGFIRWLIEFGERNPGHVLMPTSDDTAWLYSCHRDALSISFRLWQPAAEAIYTLLNKPRLARACAEVGLNSPKTWVPASAEELEGDRPPPFPVLVKPQTQVLFQPHKKGAVVREKGELRASYEAFVSCTRYAPVLLAQDPDVGRPMIQAFEPGAAKGIYSLSGFVDETADLFIVRASRKVLQRPRALGVGLCFEEAEPRADLAAKVAALCLRVGYHGVFEVEFVEAPSGPLLIDFNPRLYGEMAFDIDRGLHLPLWFYLAALGERDQLRSLIAQASQGGKANGRVFCSRVQMRLFLWMQLISGSTSMAELRLWNDWLARHRGRTTDPTLESEDWLPGLVDAVQSVYGHLRHPRAVLRVARER